jgi:hypothetical protein
MLAWGYTLIPSFNKDTKICETPLIVMRTADSASYQILNLFHNQTENLKVVLSENRHSSGTKLPSPGVKIKINNGRIDWYSMFTADINEYEIIFFAHKGIEIVWPAYDPKGVEHTYIKGGYDRKCIGN